MKFLLITLIVLALAPAAHAGTFISPWPTVHCADTPALIAAHAAGVYHDDDGPDHGTIDMRLYICRGLADLQAGKPVTENRYQSLHLLAHELSHAAGYGHHDVPENTDCHAWKISMRVAHHIGLPSVVLRALARDNRNYSWYCQPGTEVSP